jgi:hypothetical protein
MYCNLEFKRLKRNSGLLMSVYAENEEGRDPIDFEASRASLTQHRRTYFRLLYPELYMIDQATRDSGFPVGLYQDAQSNAPRVIEILDRDGQVNSSKHHISFWCTNSSTKLWKGQSKCKYLRLQTLILA